MTIFGYLGAKSGNHGIETLHSLIVYRQIHITSLLGPNVTYDFVTHFRPWHV